MDAGNYAEIEQNEAELTKTVAGRKQKNYFFAKNVRGQHKQPKFIISSNQGIQSDQFRDHSRTIHRRHYSLCWSVLLDERPPPNVEHFHL